MTESQATWLIVFVALTALAILIQAGAMFGMFLAVRRVTARVESLEDIVETRLKMISSALEEQIRSVGERGNRAVETLRVEMEHIKSLMGRVDGMIGRVESAVSSASNTLEQMAESARRSSERVEQAIAGVGSLIDSFKGSVERTLQSAQRTLDETGAGIRRSFDELAAAFRRESLRPLREISALVSGARAAIDFLSRRERREERPGQPRVA